MTSFLDRISQVYIKVDPSGELFDKLFDMCRVYSYHEVTTISLADIKEKRVQAQTGSFYTSVRLGSKYEIKKLQLEYPEHFL